MRILLVEDSARLQHSMGTALRKTGYAVDLAGDGEEGLWLAGSHDYDVIVLDIMLPKRDGLSVLAELRRRGQVVSRAEIEAHIYDEQVDPMSNVVDSAVCSLRKKARRGRRTGVDPHPSRPRLPA